MKNPYNQSKFSGKGLEKRVQKIINGKTHIKTLYGWVREGRINADQFELILEKMKNDEVFNS